MARAPAKPKPPPRRVSERRADIWRAIAVCGLLVLAVMLVFAQTLRQGFAFDDQAYVTGEPHVSHGLSWSGVAWAFTAGPTGEWYPLAMLSHMLDCQFFGLNPAGHHLTSLLLHAASAAALFLVLWRMTGALWPSALVATLFALHPLHVESVAWISERRDVLSGLFFMLTLGAYGEYVRRPHSIGRYLAVVGFFALGLLAKPMLVTLPPLLLLLDFWPLGRIGRAAPAATARAVPFDWRPIVDKLPLFGLAIAAAALTLLTHSEQPDRLPLADRLANAAVSCVAYLGQLVVPCGLSVFYSYPAAGWPGWQVAAAAALLLAITVAVVVGRRSYPYCFVGWFWYVGMLVPVLGLTVLGVHARADRYTYLSQIGLYIALVWGASRLAAAWPARRWIFGIASGLMLIALLAASWRQTRFWQNEKTLWQHALVCDPQNVTAHYNLAVALEATDQGAAEAHFRQAVEIDPGQHELYRRVRAAAHNALGNTARRQGEVADAFAHYQQALALDPANMAAHLNLGRLLVKQGDLDEAIFHFRRSHALEPGDPMPSCCIAVALSEQGKIGEAIASYRQALSIDPGFEPAKQGLRELSNR